MQQLGFDFMDKNDYDVNNFIVFDGNIEAFCFLNNNKEDENILNNQLIFLNGEKKCGKTHLGYIWKQKHNAKTINYESLFSLKMDDFIKEINNSIEQFDYYILDNLENTVDEEKIFYLLNTVLINNSAILIISEFNIFKTKIKLEDLKSRINSGVNLTIKKLSKDIKTMFIVKLCSDKQLNLSAEIIRYLNKKLDTKYETIFNFIKNILPYDEGKLTLKNIKILLK